MKRVFSGIQPSGTIQLGNYLGAIKHHVNLQKEYDCLYCIVDLHAITVRQDPEELRQNVRKLAAIYLACGLDEKKCILFAQSHVKEHAELAWILNCYTQLGELERMTQFKDKAKQHKENINAGLFTYPALMAADVLLYNANLVPVGEDQKQHIELMRDIAKRFNHIYGDIITVPEPMIAKQGARIMGLDDASKKMSKSADSEYNYISLLDDKETIEKKIMKAQTDSDSDVKYDVQNKPEISNLLTIFSLITDKSIKDLELKYQGKGYGDFKKDLAKAVIEFIDPIQEKYNSIYKNTSKLDKILDKGAKKARKIAEKNIAEIKNVIGLR